MTTKTLSMSSFLEELESLQGGIDGLTAELKKKMDEFWQGPSLWEQIQAFVHAVDWTEPWIIGLLAAEVSLLLLAVLTREQAGWQYVIFILCCGGVYLSESLNSLAASHWQRFSTQNYFDSSGLFLSVVFSGPLLLISVLLVIQMLMAVIRAMVRWKRAELKHRARQEARSRKKAD